MQNEVYLHGTMCSCDGDIIYLAFRLCIASEAGGHCGGVYNKKRASPLF